MPWHAMEQQEFQDQQGEYQPTLHTWQSQHKSLRSRHVSWSHSSDLLVRTEDFGVDFPQRKSGKR